MPTTSERDELLKAFVLANDLIQDTTPGTDDKGGYALLDETAAQARDLLSTQLPTTSS